MKDTKTVGAIKTPLNVKLPETEESRTYKAINVCKMIRNKTLTLPKLQATIQPA